MISCKQIQSYINFVRHGPGVFCKEQYQLVDLVEHAFQSENLTVNEVQLQRYLGFEKYFPFKLLSWEQFVFALHNCVYKSDGLLRWPVLFILVGRGAGKNGYLSFEDFCLLTPVNGVREYDIDTFAVSEAQAKTTFEDVYNVLEANKTVMRNKFRWNLETITNLKTGSRLRYHTRAPESKDGGRPGKVDCDEEHAYKDRKLMNVANGGLGKKKHPRRTIISTQGYVRGGPLDEDLQKSLDILDRKRPDNGWLPFICRLDSDDEVMNPDMWPKANPSLLYFPTLQQEIALEFEDYKSDPTGNPDFPTKRMNRPPSATADSICSWDDVLATKADLPNLRGRDCIAGVDYMLLSDFCAVGLLFRDGDRRYWITHSWVCRNSRDWDRIHYPILQAEQAGLLTVVNDVEIRPELVTDWLSEKAKDYNIKYVCCDTFRFALLRDALEKIGFRGGKGGNIWLTRTSQVILVTPVVISMFLKRLIAWGDNSLMRWYTWNVKRVMDKGNTRFEKIEPKSRKTDGFYALCHAMTKEDELQPAAAATFIDPVLGR